MAVPGRYSVTYLIVREDALAIVDVGSISDHARILSAIDWLGRPKSQVRFVIPTHLHFDHAMGIDSLATTLGAHVALGEVALSAVREGRRLPYPKRYLLPKAVPTWIWQGMPVFAIDDLRRGGDFGFPWSRNRFQATTGPELQHKCELEGFPGWTVLSTPGHAADAICLYHAAAGFLIAGDTVRNYYGGEWNSLVCKFADYATTRSLLTSLPISTIFPGHGPVIEGDGVIKKVRKVPFYLP